MNICLSPASWRQLQIMFRFSHAKLADEIIHIVSFRESKRSVCNPNLVFLIYFLLRVCEIVFKMEVFSFFALLPSTIDPF